MGEDKELKEFIEQDITFCMNDCDNYECFRNKKRAIINRPHSFAYFKNTEYCENFNKK